MAYELQLVISGLTVGAIYALVAIGFTLIYTASDVINFAQGEFVMLGGIITATLLAHGVALPIAISIAIGVTVLVGLCFYVLAIEPARGASPVVLIIITIGVSILVRGLASVIFGKGFLTVPAFLPIETLKIGEAILQTQSALVVLGSTLIVIALWLFLRLTLVGKAMRANAENRLAATLVGIHPSVMVAAAFAVSALIGAVGGVLVAPITLISFDVGTMLAVKGFAAAMLGGVTHPAGPVLGGLIIGLLEAFGAGHISSQYKDVFAFLVLLGVFFLRPQGILSYKLVERV